MEESSRIKMIERVVVAKFDHTHEDCPTEPVDVIMQETVTEVSLTEAVLLGWQPQVEASGTVHLGTGDTASPKVGD
jgi:hypothetical protein